MHRLRVVVQLVVALLAEGVDRNSLAASCSHIASSSPSSRRAWIEISDLVLLSHEITVALLAEGVDRNLLSGQLDAVGWVALLAEGVDRNRPLWYLLSKNDGRPPRGGRG